MRGRVGLLVLPGNLVDGLLDQGVDAFFDAGVDFFQQLVHVFFQRGVDAAESVGAGRVACEPMCFLEADVLSLKVGGGGWIVLDCFFFPRLYCLYVVLAAAVNLKQIVLELICVRDRDAVA